MNILIDDLPTSVEIDGVNYNISSNFRSYIKLELIMNDSDLTEVEKLYIILQIFYGDQKINNLQKAVDAVLWMYRGGEEITKREEEEHEGDHIAPKPIYDFNYDADLIYAAFLTQYNIDLNSIEYMHWWKFRALLRGLSEESRFSKVLFYRTVKITSDMTKEQKKFYREMKRIHGLPDNRTEEDKEAEFHNVLGGLL
jgi:hypothetical protein